MAVGGHTHWALCGRSLSAVFHGADPWCGAKIDIADVHASKRRDVDSSGGSDLR